MKPKIFLTISLNLLLLFIIFSFGLILPATIYGQDASEVYSEDVYSQDILIKKTDISNYPVVNIYLSFKDGSELGALDLRQEDFNVSENGEKVENLSITRVSQVTEPIGVVLVLDTSGSMKGEPISDLAGATLLFLSEMRSIDEFSIVGFSDEVTVYSTFTSDRQKLRDSISEIEAKGETSLFDGIVVALNQFKSREDIKYRYLIVLSDGKDTVSKLTLQDAIDKALENNTVVYSIALLSSDFNPDDLRKISEKTGGEMLVTVNSKELKELYETISRKIINQYRISYTSLWPNTENIKVSINIRKSGISGSAVTDYKNPFYVREPSEVISVHKRPFYLAIFDKWWSRVILYGAIFVGVVLFLYAFSLLLLPRPQTLKERTQIYGYIPQSRRAAKEFLGEEEERKGLPGRVIRLVSRLASRRGFVELFDLKLERAGINIRASEFITLHLIIVAIASIGAYYLVKNLIIALLIVLIAVLSPFLLLNVKASQRLKRFHEQLPDALQLISGSLKAGYSFNQALSMIVDETRPPISDEFRKTLSLIRMGLPEREALENMAERINSEYFNWTVMAINVQREVGGNLAEVMETISNTIRERDRVMNQIRSLTAEGRLSAIILIILPIAVFLMLFILNRDYISLMFTTKLGLAMLGVAGVMMVAGIIWILKIVQIKY